MKVCLKYLEENKSDIVQCCRAKLLIQEENYQEALIIYDAILSIDPNNLTVLIEKA